MKIADAQRSYIEELLRAEGLRVYFDGEEQSDLWGKRLRRRLADVYSKESKYCGILVSAHYKEKRWTQYEWNLLRGRLREDFASRRNDPAVLPVKLDDTNLDYLREDCAYLDARIVALRRIAECVRTKLRRS